MASIGSCCLIAIFFIIYVSNVTAMGVEKPTPRPDKLSQLLRGRPNTIARPTVAPYAKKHVLRVPNREELLGQLQMKPTPNPMLALYQPWLMNEVETESERAERIHFALEKMLTFVNIAGQVEDYLASQLKTAVKKMSTLVESGEEMEVAAKPGPNCN